MNAGQHSVETAHTTLERIRAAERLIRERAEAATPGPWRVGAEGSEGSRVNPRTGDKREDSRWIASVNGRVQPEDGHNARHIATWHPVAALAVADMLHQAAMDLWAHGPLCECGTGCDACDDNLWEPHARAALSLADVVLPPALRTDGGDR